MAMLVMVMMLKSTMMWTLAVNWVCPFGGIGCIGDIGGILGGNIGDGR